MSESLDRGLARLGAFAGFAAVSLLVTLIAATPSLPGPDASIAEIAGAANDERGGLLLGSYLGALMGAALLVFGACVAARLRRAEGAGGGWSLVAITGIAGTGVIGIVSNALVVAFVRAVEHGVRGDALWLGYSADHALGTLMAVPLGVFMLGAGMGGRATGGLPRPLCWAALTLAPLLVAGGGSITGNELEGGPLAALLLLGYAGSLVWIVAVSVGLWRGATGGVAATATRAESDPVGLQGATP